MTRAEKTLALKEVFNQMELIFMNSWKFILHFFFIVTDNYVYNKMSIPKMAQIFAPLMFRPAQYGSDDMTMGSQLSELLQTIIIEQDYIFEDATNSLQSFVQRSNS